MDILSAAYSRKVAAHYGADLVKYNQIHNYWWPSLDEDLKL